ncbi:MAG TPA: caspase family protein [Thermoanaerobaculia bacterium]|nr:caspase family protein [Thermoanaerobaculia bacterium]
MPVRRALLVGIDSYPRLAPRYQLAGCANDVRAMAGVLTERFAFPEDRLTTLLDGAATREGLLGALEALLEQTAPGDSVLFYFSGHGSQKRDADGDEDDGWDETLVAADSGRAPDPNRDLVDDEIGLWLGRLSRRTSNITLIFDSCHSGTATRGEGRTRGVEPDWRWPPGAPLVPRRIYRRGPEETKGPSGWLSPAPPCLLLAGCRAGERSHEVEIGSGGLSHGALTYFLVETLRQISPRATWGDVFAALAPKVNALYPEQNPQLEGDPARTLF